MQTEHFILKGLALQPDLVIINYFVNDVEPTPQSNKLWHAISSRSYLSALLFDRLANMTALTGARPDWLEYYSSLYTSENEALKLNAEATTKLIKICREHNIKVLVGSYPDLHRLKPYPLPEAIEHIRTVAETNEAPFLDLLSPMQAYEPEKLWVSNEDTHGNAQAARIVAEEYAAYLLNTRMLEQAH